MKKRQKRQRQNTKFLIEYLFEKRQERKDHKVTTEENPCLREIIKHLLVVLALKKESSKWSLEPVRESKVPVKVREDMTAGKVCVLSSPKKHSDYHQFFSGFEYYVLLYSLYETCVPYNWYRWAICRCEI